jgi:Leucine Rich repeats (2 copies)/Leucine Rich Repeat
MEFLEKLDVSSNSFSFEHLEANAGGVEDYFYSPQDTTYNLEIVGNTAFVDVKGTDLKYAWFVNDEEVNGTNSSDYRFDENTIIKCRVSSKLLPELELWSEEFGEIIKQKVYWSFTNHDIDELNKLYFDCDGKNWKKKSGWPITTESMLNSEDPYGLEFEYTKNIVFGNDSMLIYQIIPRLIKLNNNNLKGVLPNLDLPKLKELMLSGNHLSGSIPDFTLPELEWLSLSFNNLSNSIPDFTLPKLKWLSFSSNNLNGSVPNLNIPNLQSLYLQNNQLFGEIPDFDLPELIKLDLANNKLSGEIPNFDLPNLRELNVSSNKYTFGPLEVNYEKYDEYRYEPQDTILPIEQIDEKIIVTVDGSENGYRWYLDGELIDSSKENYYTPVVDGVYHCFVDDNIINLVLSSNTISVVNTRIENANSGDENVRIIHSNEILSVHTNGKYLGSEIKIFNNIGERIYSGKISNSDESVDISEFASGLYNFVLIKNNQIMSSKKFIIGR